MSDSVLMGNTMHLDPIEESPTKANRRCATSPCATVSKIAGAVKEDEIDDNWHGEVLQVKTRWLLQPEVVEVADSSAGPVGYDSAARR